MNKLTYSNEIVAPKPKIWEALWNEDNYRKWAAVFFEGSYIVANSWEEESRILFLGPDKNGIYSIIDEHIPNISIRFKHLGNFVEGKEQDLDEETKLWSGATESYSISDDKNGNHLLSIKIDVMDEHLDFMKEKLPLALQKIKEMCSLKN
ncbi:MAG: hypothetical protein P8P74_18010 [Crocinitomicaceae bacterium]|nr:hypothetical protein [Crocinitomicaceae bacterium]